MIIKKGKRARAYAYTFRATEEEKEIIDLKFKQSGRTMTDFVIRSITDKPIVSVAHGAEILSELKRQGNNLNQAVKSNYFGDATEQELLSCVDLCKETYRKILEAIGGT